MYSLLGTWVNAHSTTGRAGLFCGTVSLPSFKEIKRLNGKMTMFLVYFVGWLACTVADVALWLFCKSISSWQYVWKLKESS